MVSNATGQVLREVRKCRCPHCSTTVRLQEVEVRVTGEPTDKRVRTTTSLNAVESIEIFGRSPVLHRVPGRCPECGGAVVFGGYDGVDTALVSPRQGERSAPLDVPDAIATDFREACAVVLLSPKAAAALARRALQHVLIDKGGVQPKASLAEQIAEVLPKVSVALQRSMDVIRGYGNFGAHPIPDAQTGAVIDVESGEAEWTIEILEEVLEEYYTRPAEVARRKAALDAKLAAANKPPSK